MRNWSDWRSGNLPHPVAVAAGVDEAVLRVVAVLHPLPKTKNEDMVLTKEELIASLQNEVRILLHLASKVDHDQLDYRPTPKQRSTIELLRYLTIMGPNVITAIKAGTFDGAAFGAAQAAANAMNFDQVVAAIAKQSGDYAKQLGAFSDADFRGEVDLFGRKTTRGSLPRVSGARQGYTRVSHTVILLSEVLRP